VKEVVWFEESGVGVLFGLVIIFCFFYGGRGVRVGDVEWGIFWCFGGSCCFIAATVARTINGDSVGCGVSGMVLGGMGSKWKPFIFDRDSENRFFIVNWDHDCFVVNVNGIKGFSWLPSGLVELDIKVSILDKGSKEVELIVVSVHADEDDTIISAQGEDGRGGESCTGELMVNRRHGSWEWGMLSEIPRVLILLG